MILAVMPNEADAAIDFITEFANFIRNSDEKSRVLIVLIDAGNPSAFLPLINLVKALKQTYNGNNYHGKTLADKIDLLTVKAEHKDIFLVVDVVIARYGPDLLYFVASLKMEIKSDFMNRIRMNTIHDYQVFFPIPFAQFNPKIAYRELGVDVKLPSTIEVHKAVGRFDSTNFELSSFYGVDYLAAKTSSTNRGLFASESKIFCDLIQLFLNTDLHVFRAVDPALKLKYYEQYCDPFVEEQAYSRCITRRKEGLASKAQLASLVLEQMQSVPS